MVTKTYYRGLNEIGGCTVQAVNWKTLDISDRIVDHLSPTWDSGHAG